MMLRGQRPLIMLRTAVRRTYVTLPATPYTAAKETQPDYKPGQEWSEVLASESEAALQNVAAERNVSEDTPIAVLQQETIEKIQHRGNCTPPTKDRSSSA